MGNCFGYAYRRIRRAGPYARLVHGTICSTIIEGHMLGHAWYTAGKRIWDWQCHKHIDREHAIKYIEQAGGSEPERIYVKGWDEKEYYNIFKPVSMQVYTNMEALDMLCQHRHLGPWDILI